MSLENLLREFAREHEMKGKGPLCVALVVTRHAKKLGLPLTPDELLTDAGGQVKGLNKSAVQSILKKYGIDRVLAEEGGRTSRGSLRKMREYSAFLNNLHSKGPVDLKAIEVWWVERVKEFFASKPFIMHFDASKSIRAVIRDLLEQAEKRQAQSPGATFVGTMLQHLVGAKLNLLLNAQVEHHGASVADESSGREGDFLIEDVAIHVTTAPTEALMRKCQKNLGKGLRPMIITTHDGAIVAESYSKQVGIGERLDVFEAEQFLAANLYELGQFVQAGRRTTADRLVREYNMIVDECETDPSLRINVS